MTIYVLRPWDKPIGYPINVTSGTVDFGTVFSPFTLGPCELYWPFKSMNVENAWQYSKIYSQHDFNGVPSLSWWHWAITGWQNPRAVRYPMGKGAVPLYSWWDNESLDYVAARKKIYIPLYAKAVAEKVEALNRIRELAAGDDVTLLDFDAYNHHKLGMSWADVVNDPTRKMGHGFVLAMMLDGVVGPNGEHPF